ncbi:hypothetical protein NESM_000458600 [Novymonas esmeraldas]|uniref:Uncharacterized protein n=1 Tax=Novymonas esmeraldas TaxID=1808958 RepID=A0AAW0ENR9_9TRYP
MSSAFRNLFGGAPSSARQTRRNTTGGAAGASPTGQYPDALPSVLEGKFRGPVVGTAVLDEDNIPLDEAAVLFEMVTPENTPLLKTLVKQRFEAAAEEEMEQQRLEEEREAQEASPSDGAGTQEQRSATAPPGRVNTFDYFPTPDLSFASFHSTKTHHRRKVLADGGYFIFSDAYLSAHPMSCITGVTNELHMAAPESEITSHPPCSGPDAEKRRLQEVKDYIKEVEHEYRPLFRRRRSGAVYGCAQYLQPGATPIPAAVEKGFLPLGLPSAAEDVLSGDGTSPRVDTKKRTSTIRELLSNSFF